MKLANGSFRARWAQLLVVAGVLAAVGILMEPGAPAPPASLPGVSGLSLGGAFDRAVAFADTPCTDLGTVEGLRYRARIGLYTATTFCADAVDSCVTNEPCHIATHPVLTNVYVAVIVHKSADPAVPHQFNGVFYGLTCSNAAVIHTGATACAGFLAAPGSPPAASGWSSTAGCRDLCTVVAYHTYLPTNADPAIFEMVAHADLPGSAGDPTCRSIIVLDCAQNQWSAFCGGRAWLNTDPLPGEECFCEQGDGPVATEQTSWGSLRSLYH